MSGIGRQRFARSVAGGARKASDRQAVSTSGIVSRVAGHAVALFFTGPETAGQKLETVLAERRAGLEAPIRMGDALSHNAAGSAETIVAYCLAPLADARQGGGMSTNSAEGGPPPIPDELRERKVAWYATLLSAFVSSRREKDKSLLALSTAGIGLLITLATTVGIPSVSIAVLYALALAAFLTAILAAIRVFDLDAKHVESLLRETHDQAPAEALRAADCFLFRSFLVGVVLSIAIGAGYALKSSERPTEESKMEAPDERSHVTTRPDAPERRSLEGIENLKPANLPNPVETPAATSPPTSSQGPNASSGASESGERPSPGSS